MNTDKTPIALFTYNRPNHTGRALDSLARCHRFDECRSYIYCDGPKSERDKAEVKVSRTVVREWAEKQGAVVIERQENLGLARSIVTGVTDLCREYGRVIVVEDDLVVSPAFLDYMLQALDRYHDDPQVYQLSGYMFPVDSHAMTEAFFLPFITTWGWATWARAWQVFDWHATGAQVRLTDADTRRRFNLDGHYPYATMLEDRLAGRNDSWGVLWWWSVFQRNGLALYPRQSLVINRGFDGSGRHCGSHHEEDLGMPEWSQHTYQFPQQIAPDDEAYRQVLEYLAGHGVQVEQAMSRIGRRLNRWFRQ